MRGQWSCSDASSTALGWSVLAGQVEASSKLCVLAEGFAASVKAYPTHLREIILNTYLYLCIYVYLNMYNYYAYRCSCKRVNDDEPCGEVHEPGYPEAKELFMVFINVSICWLSVRCISACRVLLPSALLKNQLIPCLALSKFHCLQHFSLRPCCFVAISWNKQWFSQTRVFPAKEKHFAGSWM